MGNTVVNPKIVLFLAAFIAFVATFNETYLNIAFTPIMAEFSVDSATVRWLATAYMLGAAVMVPITAFLYKSFKTRNLFIVSALFLILGSVIAAFSVNFTMLLVARIIQSIGTGIMIPLGMNINIESAPRDKIGLHLGVAGAMIAIGPSVSVIASGALLSVMDWRGLFWIYTALAAVCLICGIIFMKNVTKLTHPKIDILSTILVGLGLIGLMYAISSIFTENLFLCVGIGLAGIVLLVIFIIRQVKIANPLLNLAPLKNRAFSIAVICNMLAVIVTFSMNIVIPLYLEDGIGITPLLASLCIFPAIALMAILSPIAGKIYDRHGIKVILPLGFAFVAAFCILLGCFIMNAAGIHGETFFLGSMEIPMVCLYLALLYIPVVCGTALIIGPVQSYALSKLPYEQNPHGVVIFSTGFQIAGCIGSSVFAGIYAATLGASGFDSGLSIALFSVAVCALAGFILSFAIVSFCRKEAKTC